MWSIACMKPRVGRRQRQIRRCFAAFNGDPVPTAELMTWCYVGRDKLERWRWTDVARSARKFGVNIKRGWWQANPELMRKIRGE
jgi:hypothetical protein